MDRSRWTRSVVNVGYGRSNGRGFVVATKRSERLVITAAHCLPKLPPAHGASYTEERIYAEILGPLGQKRTVWAECVFADPIADLAVLRALDDPDFAEKADGYEHLVDAAVPLPIADLALIRPPITSRATSFGTITIESMTVPGPPSWEGRAWLLSLDGRWFRCAVSAGSRGLNIPEAAEPIEGGMSGSPIVSEEGRAIGVVTLNIGSYGGNPFLAAALPGWLLAEIRIGRPNRVST